MLRVEPRDERLRRSAQQGAEQHGHHCGGGVEAGVRLRQLQHGSCRNGVRHAAIALLLAPGSLTQGVASSGDVLVGPVPHDDVHARGQQQVHRVTLAPLRAVHQRLEQRPAQRQIRRAVWVAGGHLGRTQQRDAGWRAEGRNGSRNGRLLLRRQASKVRRQQRQRVGGHGHIGRHAPVECGPRGAGPPDRGQQSRKQADQGLGVQHVCRSGAVPQLVQVQGPAHKDALGGYGGRVAAERLQSTQVSGHSTQQLSVRQRRGWHRVCVGRKRQAHPGGVQHGLGDALCRGAAGGDGSHQRRERNSHIVLDQELGHLVFEALEEGQAC